MTNGDKRCCICGDRGFYEDYLFEYGNSIYCFKCLEDMLCKFERMRTYSIKRFFTDDGQELGSDDDTYSLFESICEEYGIKQIGVY